MGIQLLPSLSVSNSQFTYSKIIGVYPRSEPIAIKNSRIINSTIWSDSYNYGISIDSSIANSCQFELGCCGANFNITNGPILNSSMYEGGGSPVAGPVQISNSKIIETPINLQLAGFTITNCTFQYSISPIGATFGNGAITNTSFIGNNRNTELEITGYNGYNVGGSVNISKSLLTNASTAISFGNANTVTIQRTNFINNNAYNIMNLSTKDLSATQNYWGTTDSTEIAAKIFDANDNLDYGVVAINPFLTAADTSAPISPPTNLRITSSSGSVQITWQSNQESDIAGYKVYYGNFTGYSFSNVVNVGNVTNTILSGASINDTVAVTAYDTQADGNNDQIEGHESWYAFIATIPTSVSAISYVTPTAYSLSQNYPNPFNPSTTIYYVLPTKSKVRIQIYNILGQLVKELVNEEQKAGYQSIIWHANVTSGLYFYKLEAIAMDNPNERFVCNTKKMIMLK